MTTRADKTFAEVGTLTPLTRDQQLRATDAVIRVAAAQGWEPSEVLPMLFGPVGGGRDGYGRARGGRR